MEIWLVSSKMSSTTDNALQLFGLIILFFLIIVATYVTSKFIGNYKLGQMKNKNFKVIETYKVAPNKFLQLIKVGNKYLVISIGKEEIHNITEIPEEDVILPIENEQHGLKFSDLIAKVQGKQQVTKDTNGIKEHKNN